VQLRRALVASGGLALAAAPAACSGDDGTGGLEFSEAPVDVGEYDYVNGVVAWEDGFVAVTANGVVFRSPDGKAWDTLDATGLGNDPDGNDESAGETAVAGLAAGDGFLLVAGTRGGQSGDDKALFIPLVWRSEDGETWQQLETSGLTARYLDTIVTLDGGFLAFGTEDIPRPPGLPEEDLEDEEEEEGTGDEVPASPT